LHLKNGDVALEKNPPNTDIVAIPLAAGVLAGQGILLSPALGAVFMSLSTVIVAGNAMLLRGKKL
jgi:P-type Cu2+ transporter